MKLNGSGKDATPKVSAKIRRQMKRLRMQVTERGSGVFDMQLGDRHTIEVAANAGGGDWHRGIVWALAVGLEMVDKMQPEEAQGPVDGLAGRVIGPRELRIHISNPQAIGGLDRLARQTGVRRADVVWSTIRTTLVLQMEQ